MRTIRLRSLLTDPDAFWSTYDAETDQPTDAWAERLTGRWTWFVAVDDVLGDVGVIAVVPDRDDLEAAAVVGFWVDPRARGRGLAHALSLVAEEHARQEGYPRLRLWVADANTVAVRLYAQRGYVRTGETGTFPPPREHMTEHARALVL